MSRGAGGAAPELWKQYDLNGDGKVIREEFMAVRATCFARYDANATGMLTRAGVKKLSPPQRADLLDAAFARLDLDGDGVISQEEFDRESARLFQQVDTNADGVIAGIELNSLSGAAQADLCQASGAPPPREGSGGPGPRRGPAAGGRQ